MIYIYIYADILANPTHMHHTKHVFCVPLHVMQSWVPLHLMCEACCLCSKKRFRAWYGYLHGSMEGKCIAFAPA